MDADEQRISVSREVLRAELLAFELRLVEKLASQEEADDHELRIRVLEKFRYAVPGAAVIAVLLSAVAFAAPRF
jgi:hypothetical protein